MIVHGLNLAYEELASILVLELVDLKQSADMKIINQHVTARMDYLAILIIDVTMFQLLSLVKRNSHVNHPDVEQILNALCLEEMKFVLAYQDILAMIPPRDVGRSVCWIPIVPQIEFVRD